MIKQAIEALVSGQPISTEEAAQVMEEIMSGETTPAQFGAFVTALRIKGESVEEIVGLAKVMRDKAIPVKVSGPTVDTCGTGGDSFNTFNISSLSALVCAGAGVTVAKHGNKSISSKCGSADIFTALGVNISAEKEIVTKSIIEAGIGFMFAPLYHPAFKHVGPVRKELKTRTIFNMMGPVVNPAKVKRQIFGIFSSELTEKFASILQKTGTQKALVFSSVESMDEISPFSLTRMSFLNNNEIRSFTFDPEKYNMKSGRLEDIQVSDVKESQAVIEDILNNRINNQTALNAVLLNAAAGIFVSKEEDDFEKAFPACIEQANESIKNLKALDALNKMVTISNE